jgi:rSAM/selenodomain-associated transferase 2
MRAPALSIVVPVLNEVESIAAVLGPLQGLRERDVEVLVVDGGSVDATASAAAPFAHKVIAALRGRGSQMNAGAAAARGEVLLFLHADTRLPPDADRLILDGLRSADRVWGRFDVAIQGRSRLLPAVAYLMNMRSRLSGIATGDQGLFMYRHAFASVGGFPDIPLMEDVAICRALKRLSRPLCLGEKVITSGRRWDQNGAWRTIFLMWRLRLAFSLGADPHALARRYGYVPRQS